MTEEVREELTLLPEERPGVVRRSLALGVLPSNEEIMSPEPIPELVRAIKAVGLLQPIVVGEREGVYHIHAGRRRLKAMRKLAAEWDAQNPDDPEDPEGLGKTAANPHGHIDTYIVDDLHWNAHSVLTLLLQNTIRENPIAELATIEELFRDGYSKEQISRETGIGESTIEKRLRLQNLHPDLREAMDINKISPGVAERAAKLSDKAQLRLADKYVEKGRITGTDVEEQTRARTQAAAHSESLGPLADLPSIDDMEPAIEEQMAERGTLQAENYLRARLEDAGSADRSNRPKWTKKDVEAVETILGALGS